MMKSKWPWSFQIQKNFGSQVPVIWDILTINQIINVIKESEIDELSISLNGSRISYLSLSRALL